MAAFTVIDHQELGVSQWAPSGNTTVSSWTKSSIPDTYDHLMLKVSARTDRSGYYYDEMDITLNADTGNNYSSTTLYTGSLTPDSTRNSNQASGAYFDCTSGGTLASTFSANTLWIPHYANTTNYKQVLHESAVVNDSATDARWYLLVTAMLWSATPAAVHTITLTPEAGDDFVRYSTITLYGVTGA
jgi:hypothetical protein